MFTAETRIFAVGRFTVQQRPRFDNPAWAVYIVFLGQRLIGKNFSLPGISDCEWLKRENGVYAKQSRALEISKGRPIRNANPRRRGRPRKADAERELIEALDT